MKDHIEAKKIVLSLDILREPPLKFLAFSENDPLPDRPNFPRNGQLSVKLRYRDEIRIILKLRTCTFSAVT